MTFVEGILRYLFPNTKLFHYERTVKIPFVGKLMLSPLRLIGRSIAVAITTVLVSNASLTSGILGLVCVAYKYSREGKPEDATLSTCF